MIESSWYTVPMLASRWSQSTHVIVNLIKSGDLLAFHRRRHGRVDSESYFETSSRITEVIQEDGSVSSMNTNKEGVLSSSAGWVKNGELVVRHEDVIRLDDIFQHVASSPPDQSKKPQSDNDPRLSDARLKVIAALIENSGINLSAPRGQAAELKRMVDAAGYGPVSADVCERMVNAIKDRMLDWD